MLLLGEQDFAATSHDSFDANSLVMVTLRQPTSTRVPQTSPRPGHSARALSVLVFDGLPPRE
jgi:hypothetical protein